ncbi:oligosaccharide flippase family protein [Ruegeria arenilitoris]|uniref:oligosaccharide flippase family protein n=1 Tax=Ruegeria arenilitoris TaxID=1173585 RepID=UPI00147F4BB3|nr:oligosaccharide flippase family protein [Ruegeria arenilitoris]
MSDDKDSGPGNSRHKNVAVSKRLVVINSASSILARILNVTVLLWAYQYLLRRIPAEEFAVLPVVTSIMVVAPLFFSFFSGGVDRYVVDAYAKGEFDRVTELVSSIVPLMAAAAGVFLMAGLLFAANIEKVLNIAPEMISDAQIMMALLVISFAMQMLAVPFRTGYVVRQRFLELNLLGIARDFVRIILLVTLLVGVGPKVIWVVVATVSSEVIYTIVTVIRSRLMVPQLRFRPGLFDRRQAKELVSFGIWTAIGKLGNIFYTNAATILLNLYGTAVDVTSYHIGSTFYRQLDTMVLRAVQPLMPVLTAMNALEDRKRLGRTVFRGGRYALWTSLAVAVPLIVYADDFINLYLGDAEYSMASVVIVLFMVIFPFTKSVALLSMTAMATAQVRPFFLPAFLSKIFAFLIMLLMAWYSDLGAIGMSLSLTVVVIGMQVGYYWPLCLKMTDRSFRDFWTEVLLPGCLPAICGAIIWSALKFYDPPESWVALLGYSALGGCVYLTTLFGFCLNTQERQELGSIAARLKTAR